MEGTAKSRSEASSSASAELRIVSSMRLCAARNFRAISEAGREKLRREHVEDGDLIEE